jgi:3',5'-cyclic-nucleotide phosphodiesterase
VELKVIGCHGGETPKHRTSAFVVDERIAIDAGSLTSGVELKGQCALEAVLVSHAHLDHVRDLATLADNRSQNGAPTLPIVGTKQTIDVLKKHFFNNLVWPDFSRIPTKRAPAIRYVEISASAPLIVGAYSVRAVPVSHSIACCAFIVSRDGASLAYSGDTGPTDRLWKALNSTPDLKALLMEVSFPNDEARLARLSGHHTPQTLAADMKKLERSREIPTLLYHIKPSFQAKVERECARLKNLNLTVCALGDHFIL